MKMSHRLKSILVLLAGIAIIVLTWVGLGVYYPDSNEWMYLPDKIYRTLKTLMGADPVSGKLADDSLPWQLTLAKIAVTVGLLAGMYKIAEALFYEYYTQLRLLFKKQPVLVIGIGNKGLALLDDLKTNHDTTGVALEISNTHRNTNTVRRQGHLLFNGDATHPPALIEAGIAKARYVICFLDNEQATINVTRALHNLVQAKPDRYRLQCFLHVNNARVVTMLQQSDYFQEERESGLDLRFFNHHQMIARHFFAQLPVEYTAELADPASRFRLVFLGAGDTMKALLVHALQVLHTLNSASPEIVICAPDAGKLEKTFHSEYSGARQVAKLTFEEYDGSYEAILKDHLQDLTPDIVPLLITAFEEDSVNLKWSLEILRATPLSKFKIFALNYHNEGLNALFRPKHNQLSRLSFFGSIESICQIEFITRQLQDTQARAIHEDYLQQLTGHSASESAAFKTGWDDLLEEAKEASRMQADHIPYKLAMTGQLGSQQDASEHVAFNPEQVELLAKVEHERWSANRYLNGWRFGEQRDDVRRQHPSLVDWEHLPEPEKQKDRDVILRIPAILMRAREMRTAAGKQ